MFTPIQNVCVCMWLKTVFPRRIRNRFQYETQRMQQMKRKKELVFFFLDRSIQCIQCTQLAFLFRKPSSMQSQSID